ncbi:hypothetical protein [Streptomyces physcomitrii]|uniref:Uncharacterized protein n=1 Tax=Streptomyces physcomitrii TaxID=2724184 RepID=A0ABX1H398_9ACTN|nr:hypothetical protein [Streptomyces physcomitrii]NKI41759.1 hypothetical protein [Streptomyces physcomitrii]
MAKHTFASYAIRIKRSREKSYLPLDNFDGGGSDLLKEFYGFFLHLQECAFEFPEKERSLEARETQRKNRSLQVKLAFGAYGIQSRIRDRTTGQVVFQKIEGHVDLTDLRNYIILPENSTAGLIFTERFQGNGVISALSEAFKKAFHAKFGGYTLEINTMTSEAAFGVYMESGEIKKIRLVRQAIPHDVAGALGLGDEETNLGTIEMMLRPPRTGSFHKQKIQSVISGETDVSSLLEWRDVTFRELKVEVKIADSLRTLSVSSGTTPAMLYDLESEMRKEGVTELTDTWVYGKAEELAEDLGKNMGLSADRMRREFQWPEFWDRYRLEVPVDQND